MPPWSAHLANVNRISSNGFYWRSRTSTWLESRLTLPGWTPTRLGLGQNVGLSTEYWNRYRGLFRCTGLPVEIAEDTDAIFSPYATRELFRWAFLRATFIHS